MHPFLPKVLLAVIFTLVVSLVIGTIYHIVVAVERFFGFIAQSFCCILGLEVSGAASM